MRSSLVDVVDLSDEAGPGRAAPKPASRSYGCHNRPPKPSHVIVRDGWIEYPIGGFNSRLPRMVELPDPMSSGCRYDKSTSDTGCTGCIHMEKA